MSDFFKKIKKIAAFSLRKKLNYFLNYFFWSLGICRNQITYPVFLAIEPVNFCNLGCSSCPTRTSRKEKGRMSLENYKKIIEEVGDYLSSINLWNWGEPFLNKDVCEMIGLARAKQIEVCVNTNGTFLNDEKLAKKIIKSGLDRLVISLDGLTPETLSIYRTGANFKELIDGIKEVIKAKKESGQGKPLIEIQFIIMKHNERELPLLADFVEGLGADCLTVKTYNYFLNKEELKKFEPNQKKYSRYGRQLPVKNGCRQAWLGLNINYDGNVVPCCFDPEERYILGNVFGGGVQETWRGQPLADFRKKLLYNKKEITICRECQYNKNTKKEIKIRKAGNRKLWRGSTL